MSVSQASEDRHPSNAVQSTAASRQQSVFKRHQTVASLFSVGTLPPCDAQDKSPTHINHMLQGGAGVEEQRRIRDSVRRQHHVKGTASVIATNASDVDAGATVAAAAATVVSSQRPTRKLQNRLSGEGAPMPSINQPQQPLRKLGRTPSSPSVLFSRVKERIREKVFETSAEWPHMAAVERERRIRAAQAFEQALRDSMAACSSTKHVQSQRQAGHQQVLRTTTGTVAASTDDVTPVSGGERATSGEKTRRVRIKSDPSRKTVVSASSTETKDNEGSYHQQLPQPSTSMLARLAFRRRSISEDTYILETKMVAAAAASAETTCGGRLLGPDSSAKNNSQGDGIICSNEDLKKIVNRHKARRSPVLSPTTTTQPTLSESHPASVQQLSVSDDVIARPSLSNTCSTGGRASTSTTESSATASVWTSHVGTNKSDAVTIVGSEHANKLSSLNSTVGVVVNTADSGGGGGVPDEGFDHVDSVGRVANDVERNAGVDIAMKETTTSVTVRDVVYDEHGQTWDVYGADFDPEILGQAIQAYLEKIMSKKLRKNPSRETTISNEMTNDGMNPRTNQERQTGRSFGLFMRHLCSPLWRQQHQPATTNS